MYTYIYLHNYTYIYLHNTYIYLHNYTYIFLAIYFWFYQCNPVHVCVMWINSMELIVSLSQVMSTLVECLWPYHTTTRSCAQRGAGSASMRYTLRGTSLSPLWSLESKKTFMQQLPPYSNTYVWHTPHTHPHAHTLTPPHTHSRPTHILTPTHSRPHTHTHPHTYPHAPHTHSPPTHILTPPRGHTLPPTELVYHSLSYTQLSFSEHAIPRKKQ